LATPGNDGSGIMLGQSVGGITGQMNSLYAANNIAPPDALLNGILVNENGERFINEDAYTGYIGLAIARQKNGGAWLILPSRSFRRAIWQALFGGMHVFKMFGAPMLINVLLGGTRRRRTLAGLANACGIDPKS